MIFFRSPSFTYYFPVYFLLILYWSLLQIWQIVMKITTISVPTCKNIIIKIYPIYNVSYLRALSLFGMIIMLLTLRLNVNRRPIRHDFQNSMKAIRYSGNTTWNISDSFLQQFKIHNVLMETLIRFDFIIFLYNLNLLICY